MDYARYWQNQIDDDNDLKSLRDEPNDNDLDSHPLIERVTARPGQGK